MKALTDRFDRVISSEAATEPFLTYREVHKCLMELYEHWFMHWPGIMNEKEKGVLLELLTDISLRHQRELVEKLRFSGQLSMDDEK